MLDLPIVDPMTSRVALWFFLLCLSALTVALGYCYFLIRARGKQLAELAEKEKATGQALQSRTEQLQSDLRRETEKRADEQQHYAALKQEYEALEQRSRDELFKAHQADLDLREAKTMLKNLQHSEQTLQAEKQKLAEEGHDLREALAMEKQKGGEREKSLEMAQLELHHERQKFAEIKADFQAQKGALKDEFRALSETILKGRQKEMEQSNQVNLKAVLSPMKEEFGKFKDRVNEVHSEQTKGQGQLENELKNLKQMNHQLSQRAENLTNALRNDKKRLGNWGELQLERLLENAGLDKNCYRREANYKTEEGANQRPDFVIDLPENKSLVIDSKVSLNAYVDSVNASTDEEALAFLKQHTTNVRHHIKSLAEKSYDSLRLLNSPDFVFLFMPNEAAYLAAYEEDPSLFDFAYDRRIAVVTPNTLLPILRTVSSLWRIDQQNRSTEALAESASRVYAKLTTFLERFEKIEGQLDTLSNTFFEAKKTLTTGKGNLIKLAEGFAEKGVKISKALPSSLSGPSS